MMKCQDVAKGDCQRAGLYAGWELAFRPPGQLLIENILLKLSTKA
jgi:hypothetical protein